jgi:hypothetical protein
MVQGVFTVWSFSNISCIRYIEVLSMGEAGMTDSSRTRTNIAALWAILALSALIMVWLFWRFPLITSIATIAILTVLGVSARLARLSDADTDADTTELQGDKQGV